jgi:hypothetical protein
LFGQQREEDLLSRCQALEGERAEAAEEFERQEAEVLGLHKALGKARAAINKGKAQVGREAARQQTQPM